jgi:hypothetical protein
MSKPSVANEGHKAAGKGTDEGGTGGRVAAVTMPTPPKISEIPLLFTLVAAPVVRSIESVSPPFVKP